MPYIYIYKKCLCVTWPGDTWNHVEKNEKERGVKKRRRGREKERKRGRLKEMEKGITGSDREKEREREREKRERKD